MEKPTLGSYDSDDMLSFFMKLGRYYDVKGDRPRAVGSNVLFSMYRTLLQCQTRSYEYKSVRTFFLRENVPDFHSCKFPEYSLEALCKRLCLDIETVTEHVNESIHWRER